MALSARREKVCSQPPSRGRDSSPIGKSLDNEDINSCPTAELPLKVKGLAAFPGNKLQVSNAELQKLRGAMFLLSVLIMGVSTFAVQSEEHTVAAGSCRFHGRHPKTRFKVEGEPLVLRCPQVLHWESTSAHVSVTWHRNDSAVVVPGEEESRVWVQDGALWIVPASQADSGTYICTVRNASYCDKMSVELRVFEKTEASVPLIFYPQIIPLSASGLLVCPDLSEFIGNNADVKIQWYKDSVPLDQDNEKFLSVRGTRLLINNVSMEDAGYYTCAMTYAHKGRQYNITRNIKLRVKRSRLTIPCKVFLGAGIHTTTLLWWTANNTLIEDAYRGGRVTEGELQAYSENNENYVEVPLIFDPVRREDLHTDFKCVVRNTMSFQTLRTTVKEAATFSWEIMLAPLSLIVLVLGGIWMHRWYKRRTGKVYGLMELKTGRPDPQSYPSKRKEII
uniref:Interleukin 1 receptor type 2 n=1 Tax=Moschus moschiferus TaxID=68415 RepID=A0A8C6CIR3_MOSMO